MTLPATNTATAEPVEPNSFWHPGFPTPWTAPALQNAPHRCPVCVGVLSVPLDFYHDEPTLKTANGERQACRTCWGAGVLWYAPITITYTGT